jgi:hypothetical protein
MTLEAALERSKKQGRKFLFAGRESGWDVTSFVEYLPKGRFEMVMSREETGESIQVAWSNGFCEGPITYRHDMRSRTLANVKTALLRMQSEPEPVEEKPRAVVAVRKLPFVIGETPESEIIKVVFGKRIVWVNTLSGKREDAVVRGKKHLRIVSGQAGRPILTFVDTAVTGFRSVALEKILQVS